MAVEATSNASGTGVTGAIRQAANLTGANFQYLLATAKVESNLNPTAGAVTSSASGLFQFIEQTWLGTMKTAGSALGYGQYASAIEKSSSGQYTVPDPSMRSQILKLRHDAAANAAMAGAYTKNNAERLTARLGRSPTEGELYIAHFLGAGGAGKLIELAETNPNGNASAAFPAAAQANRSIFYERGGAPRTFAQVTQLLARKYDVARGSAPPIPKVDVAQAGTAPTRTERTARIERTERTERTEARAAFLAYIPVQAAAHIEDPAALRAQRPETARTETPRNPMVDVGGRRDAIAPAVRELWGRPYPQQLASAQPNNGTLKEATAFDLFTDGGRNVRGLFTGT